MDGLSCFQPLAISSSQEFRIWAGQSVIVLDLAKDKAGVACFWSRMARGVYDFPKYNIPHLDVSSVSSMALPGEMRLAN